MAVKRKCYCVFELSSEIEIFLDQQGKQELSSYFKEAFWMQKLAYLADIFTI
jgi:hypothetical protein